MKEKAEISRLSGGEGWGRWVSDMLQPFSTAVFELSLPSDATGSTDLAQWGLFEAWLPIALKGSIRCILGLGIFWVY